MGPKWSLRPESPRKRLNPRQKQRAWHSSTISILLPTPTATLSINQAHFPSGATALSAVACRDCLVLQRLRFKNAFKQDPLSLVAPAL